ncbi:MAG: hypothetical protein J6W76_00860 [Spirochaetales bacterium]|nr:hypothetical protein [Spirochaetales bacterium]
MSSLIIMIVVIAIFGLVFMGGFFLNKKGNQLGEDEKHLQERLNQLPVLTSEKDIAEAIKGAPKDYLIKNYRFEKCEPVMEDVFEVLTGKYLCVDITEETYTLIRKKLGNMRAGESPYYTMWVEKPYRQIVGGFCFNDGTPIEGADSARFIFSFNRKMQRVFKSEINPDKVDSFFMSRYYPDRSLNMADPEKVAQDFIDNLKKDSKNYVDQLGEKEKTFSTRYNFTYMSQGDKATFAARLGDGKADMNVFDDANVVIVDGSKIPISDQNAIIRVVYKVFGYLLMSLSGLIGSGVLVALILSLFEKK